MLSYSDGTLFAIHHAEIWAIWPDSLTLADAATYLLGPVLGMLLRLHGVTALHASAVVIDHQAVLFVGPGGAGKSTLAAGFARRGYPILTDDVAAVVTLGDQWAVQPGYPRLRLWSDSVERLFGRADSLPQLTPNWEKCYLDLESQPYCFQSDAAPLAAIYLLTEADKTPGLSQIETISPRAGLVSLLGNLYASYLPDVAAEVRAFDLLSQVSSRVRVRALSRSTAGWPCCDLILAALADDARGLPGSLIGERTCTALPITAG